MFRKTVFSIIACLLFTLPALPAIAGEGNGRTFLIHAKTSMKLDDAQICAVPNVAWAALAKGYKVTILFDASGVTAIKKGTFWSSNSPLDSADLPERERKSLTAQLGVPLNEVPKNYGEYIRFLKEKKGVQLFANRTMMLLYKIGEDDIEPAVVPVGLEKMVEIIESADVYVAY